MTKRRKTANADITGRKYRNARDRFRAKCEELKVPCHLCGQPIDYGLNAIDPWELDHFYARSKYPELTDDPGNWRAIHKRCNSSRGNDDVRPTLGVPSEEW